MGRHKDKAVQRMLKLQEEVTGEKIARAVLGRACVAGTHTAGADDRCPACLSALADAQLARQAGATR